MVGRDWTGEIRWRKAEMRTPVAGGLLQADVNGDGVADFEVQVIGVSAMLKTDFLGVLLV